MNGNAAGESGGKQSVLSQQTLNTGGLFFQPSTSLLLFYCLEKEKGEAFKETKNNFLTSK
jgi:hypothetical protein